MLPVLAIGSLESALDDAREPLADIRANPTALTTARHHRPPSPTIAAGGVMVMATRRLVVASIAVSHRSRRARRFDTMRPRRLAAISKASRHVAEQNR